MGHRWIPLALLALPGTAAAQEWDTPAVRALVARAVASHAREVDSAGSSYRALARGLVTFHAELGPPGASVSRLLKADELEVEVYWEGGRGSKQRIRAWRDSTLFPTGVNYHRDHLGIVTDDFGDLIRIGEGDEVAAVPHPLSGAGAMLYQFRAGDTVRVGTPQGALTLVAIDVRPRDPARALAIGTVFVEVERAVQVRTHLTFTPAAYRDQDLEHITVRLERALVDGRRWLPFRQEIEIRRRSALLDFPLTGVIRGRWEIGDYELGAALPAELLAGPAIGGLRAPGGRGTWSRPLLRALEPAASPSADAEVDAIRRRAARLAGGRLLDGLPRIRPGAGSLSQLVHVNRVQGLAVGGGLSWRPGGAWEVRSLVGVGTADGRVTAGGAIARAVGPGRLTLAASRSVEDLAPEMPVASGVLASLAAQEGGRDYGHFVLLERIGLTWRSRVSGALALDLALAREWAWSVGTAARPARGSYAENPPLGSEPFWVGRVGLDASSSGAAGIAGRLRIGLEAGSGDHSYGRVLVQGERTARAGPGELGIRLAAGAGASLPARRSFAVGGRGTLPGEPFREWGGARAAWATVEWLAALPSPSIPLGRFGRTSPGLRAGPFVGAAWAAGAVPGAPWRRTGGMRPVAGVAMELFDRALRVEIAQPLRGGRGPGVVIDLARVWWPVL